VGLAAAFILYWGGRRAGDFLASDPRFALPASRQEAGPEVFELEGLHYVPRRAVEEVFSQDWGRSIYRIPLAERRRQLKAIEWVREASVARRWPRRLAVRIVERTPVAFVLLSEPDGASPRTLLVDEEGVLMRLPERAQFALPVLRGVRAEQSLAERRARVAQMLRLLSQAQPYADQIAEIDLSDPTNAVVIMAWGGRALRLWLGEENWGERLRLFRDYYPQISRRAPEADTFDLRVDGQIRAVASSEAGGAVPGKEGR